MDHQEKAAASAPDDKRYRLLIDSIADYAIYMLDLDGRIASWNLGAQRFKGYVASEIIGEHFSRFYTDKDRADGLPERALRVAAEEGRYEMEGWRLRKDGTRFWAHAIIDAIRSETGELLGFAKITRDLTERRAAEESLRRSQEQFRLLVQGVTDYAIYMLDPDGYVTNWNAGAQRIKGYAPDEIIGRRFSEFYTPEDRAAGLPDRALRIAAAEGRFENEGWRLRKNGDRFWAHVIIDPIRGDDGEIIGFAKITRDVTERNAARKELEETREALVQSQKLEAIGQLTGGVAHDFNNLLMAIIGSLELVGRRIPQDPKITPLLNNAMQAAERGAALTQRMLSFARKQELKLQAVDLPTLVLGMTDLLQSSMTPAVVIQTDIPAGLPPARTDPVQLEAALLNLVVNARDAMPEGGVVRIEARAEPGASAAGLPAGDYLRLSVTDTGQGMDAQTLVRATEPFFTTKGVGKGTGLGLPMVHGLAEQSGGRLVLRSRPGEGTTVDIWLPQAEHLPAQARPPAMPALLGAAKPLTVLAVDDDNLVLMNTVAMLEELGHRAFAADSALDALETLGREHIDLIITDYAMPKITGVQLADAVKATRPATQVILATGYAELPPGADPHLPRLAKPFLQHDLAMAIHRASCRMTDRAVP